MFDNLVYGFQIAAGPALLGWFAWVGHMLFQMNAKLSGMDQRISDMDKHMDQRLNDMDKRFDHFDRRLGKIEDVLRQERVSKEHSV